MMIMQEEKLIANPAVVLREEFDNWAILFDPDTGQAFGINPLGVLVWKSLNGKYTIDDILERIHESAEHVPSEAEDHIRNFLRTVVELGLACYTMDGAQHA